MKGYIIYSVKQKLKQEFVGLPGDEIKKLRLSGVEVCPYFFPFWLECLFFFVALCFCND